MEGKEKWQHGQHGEVRRVQIRRGETKVSNRTARTVSVGCALCYVSLIANRQIACACTQAERYVHVAQTIAQIVGPTTIFPFLAFLSLTPHSDPQIHRSIDNQAQYFQYYESLSLSTFSTLRVL